ncbi:MAG: group 1 glycosyl transferase [Parcubacteria group bacterium Gr01-1014_106]|nr:MAG: group 1 glycosyl transferase [Parcubacteria group bacterium Gr01-1014_106]
MRATSFVGIVPKAMEPLKRVLVLAPTPFFADRGCHMHIAEQTYALQRRGLEPLIVTYHLGRDLPGLNIRRTVRVPWYRKLGPGPSWHKFYVDPLLLRTALRAARQFRPHIIHAHLHEGCVLGSVLRQQLGIPLLFDVQGSLTGELLAHRFPLAQPEFLRNAWYALERWIDHLPDVLVAQSTEMRQELLEKFRVPRERLFMAYDGVNTNVFRPGERDPYLVSRLGIPKDRKVIVYLGGLDAYKGVDALLDAFPEILRKVPEAFLLLMGYPREDHYRTRAEELGVAHAVRVTGKIAYEDAPRYLTLGDIAVAPKRSQTEANGKIYTYMACGLPTVAFDTVVNRDILGDLGVYVRPMEDTRGMGEAITELLRDDEKRREIAERVRERAVREYSWDTVAGRLIDAYEAARTLAIRGAHARSVPEVRSATSSTPKS